MQSYLASLLLLAASLHAQDPNSRTAVIEKERDAKAAKLEPDEVTPAEKRLRMFKDAKYLERLAAGYNGLRVKIGNMVTGGGFAIGPEYFRAGIKNTKRKRSFRVSPTARSRSKALPAIAITPRCNTTEPVPSGRKTCARTTGWKTPRSMEFWRSSLSAE